MTVTTDPVRAALVECLRFLIVEEHWEYFREEFLSGGDAEKANVSASNAEKLRRFLRDLAARHEDVARCVKEAGE